VLAVIGLTADMIGDFVVVDQSELLDLFDKTPLKRAEYFQRLFQLDRAAKLYDLVSKKLAGLTVPTPGTDVDVLRQQVISTEQQQAKLLQELQQLPSLAQCRTGVETNRDYITAAKQAMELKQRIDAGEANVLRWRREAENADAAEAACATLCEHAQATAAQREESANAARTWLGAQRAAEQHKLRVAQCQRAVAAAEADLANFVTCRPVPPDDYVASDRRDSLLAEADGRLLPVQRLLASLDPEAPECPTCGTPAATVRPRWEAAKLQYPELKAARERLALQVDSSAAYDRAAASYTERLAAKESTLQIRQSDLAAAEATVIETSPVPVSELQLAITAAAGAAETAAKLLADRQRNQVAATHARAVMATTEQQVASARAALVGLPTVHDALTVANAESAMQQWQKLYDQRVSVQAELEALTTSLASFQKLLTAAEATVKKAAAMKVCQVRLQALRDLLHPQAAPLLVSKRKLQQLQAQINERLDTFGCGFRVRPNDKLLFEALFPDGRMQPDQRLSKGQQMVLALSIRIALNAMQADKIGSLFLDEPTAYLDTEHVRACEPVFAKLRDFSKQRGLQVVVITHERELAPIFDQVVDLTAGAAVPSSAESGPR
jgi:DNA repair exonuclease SbcCD ATPase subunit